MELLFDLMDLEKLCDESWADFNCPNDRQQKCYCYSISSQTGYLISIKIVRAFNYFILDMSEESDKYYVFTNIPWNRIRPNDLQN